MTTLSFDYLGRSEEQDFVTNLLNGASSPATVYLPRISRPKTPDRRNRDMRLIGLDMWKAFDLHEKEKNETEKDG